MESLKELYRIGPGPSSTHTLGVKNACTYYLNKNPQANHFVVELYGSLSLTGKGHGTDGIIAKVFGSDKVDVIFMNMNYGPQPNTMVFSHDDGLDKTIIYSTGGGAIFIEGVGSLTDPFVYPERSLEEIQEYCLQKDCSIADYVYNHEDVEAYLYEVEKAMIAVVETGLTKEGKIPGNLFLDKTAKHLLQLADECDNPSEKDKLYVTAFAYAAMEENNSGGTVVTAPTLGSCGTVAAIVNYYHRRGVDDKIIVDGLAVAGVIGNLVKSNATIAGAVGGCQAEIGTACAMAAALSSYVEGLCNYQVEFAAEVAMEHHLGLTCDPVGGYVQIPCIERNGVAAMRALDAMMYAKYLGTIKKNRISFDMVVRTMNYTGKKIPAELRETSLGGLAEVLPVKAH